MTIDWFKFEDKELDFPFYKNNPKVSIGGWILLFFVLIFGFLTISADSIPIAIIGCIVIVGSVLYFLKWDYKAIFQKPALRDLALVAVFVVAQFIYAIVVLSLLSNFMVQGPDLLGSDPITIKTFVLLAITLMTEEFVKFIPFMFFMYILYKYTDNRKLSIIVSMLLVMVFFAYIHVFDLRLFMFTIFVQGFGSIFEFLGYIKTKNMLVSYLVHVIYDAIMLLIATVGM